jgi:multidrug efflux system membrane fusion protein
LVTTAVVEQKSVPLRLSAIGTVEPYATVAVRSRVDGQIMEVGFREGEPVRKGQVLLRIDPRPYEAALHQAEAAAARDTAQRDQARSQERRYQELLEKNFVSKESYAQMRTNAASSEAVSRGSAAAIESARLNLEYTTIRSPIDGYPGKLLVQQGNLVRAADANPLVVVNQMQPIYVSFAVPQQWLAEVRGYMQHGTLAVDAVAADVRSGAPVPPSGTGAGTAAAGEAAASGAPAPHGKHAQGRLSFIDNSVDPTTGTIKMRAQFANEGNVLWPGEFVNVSLQLTEQTGLVVPAKAVQVGPSGQYVFVV